MQDRVGTLHLNYSLRRGSTLGPALAPGFDRAVRAGLADALSRRMTAMMGNDTAVIVIRELEATVALGGTDAMLDGRVVDHVCRSAADAVADLLAHDTSPEAVMRFTDQTEFVGSFNVALLEGSAWSRWYFGAFERLRQADTVTTLRAVLEDCGANAARVFGWLSHRGRLAAVLALISPQEARRMAEGGPRLHDPSADGTQALIEAARRLLGALDASLAERAGFDARIARLLSTALIPVDWTSSRSPSVRVLELMHWVMGDAKPIDPAHAPAEAAALRSLLAGPLDWLDARWLESELIAGEYVDNAPAPRTATTRRHLLTPRQDRLLEKLSMALRERHLRLRVQADADELIVQLVAWAAHEHGDADEPPDRSVAAVIEHAVRATLTLRNAPAETRGARFDEPSTLTGARPKQPRMHDIRSTSIAALRNGGPAALRLLYDLADALHPQVAPGTPTNAAGIFLLARAVTDVRLPSLAARFGIATGPLLEALAAKWLSCAIEPDEVLALWNGSKEFGEPGTRTIDATALQALNESLTGLLIDRGALPAETARLSIEADAARLDMKLECSPETDAQLSRTACLLVRGWARWLPGVSEASTSFLLERCVRRTGRVRIDEDHVFVQLEPAPLDVVLKMAGYLAPVGTMPWLGDRSIAFDIPTGGPAT